MSNAHLPVAIIGAGPVGLAAAAHLAGRGQSFIVLEAGPSIATSVRQWAHVRMFTPWRYCVDTAALTLLDAAGWVHPPTDAIPTGGQLVAAYLDPLAALPALAPHIRLRQRVLAVTRKGSDKVRTQGRPELPFILRLRGPAGELETIEARAVIDASGTWFSPNPAGADGLPAIGEPEAANRIAYGIPDVLGAERHRYAGRTTAVIGAGYSALNVLIELAALREVEPETRVLWIMRRESIETAFGGEAADGLPARGALGSQARNLVESGAVEVLTPFRIGGIQPDEGAGLLVLGDHAGLPSSFKAHELIVATGFRPELGMLREVRLSLDPWLECAEALGPLIDPNLHSCGTVRPHGARELTHPDDGFFIAGMKSYGRAPTFLLATGHEQVRSIAAALAGDMEAAARVELELPETGVCSAPAPSTAPGATPCSGKLLWAVCESCGGSSALVVLRAIDAENQCLLLDRQDACDGTRRMTITIYHNPDCGTSRNTLAMIRNSGAEPVVIEYLKTPPTRLELVDLIRRMAISVRALLREKGTPFGELSLDNPALTDDQLLDAMMAHPILINRPIVVTPLGVKLCRPSETVLAILPEGQRSAFVKEDGEKVLDGFGERLV